MGNSSEPGLYAKIRWSDLGEEAVKGGLSLSCEEFALCYLTLYVEGTSSHMGTQKKMSCSAK